MSSISALVGTSYVANTSLSHVSSSSNTITATAVSSNSSSNTVETASTVLDSEDSLTLSDASKSTLASSQSAVTDPFAGKTLAELQKIRSEVMQELSQSDGVAGIAKDTTQLPVPATAERLASAKMATEYVNSGGQTQNPFAGLSRSALTAIIYDQSGTYTINERSAALGLQENNDSAFLTAASNQTIATGNRSSIYTALLELNQHQLPVEKAVSSEFLALSTTTAELTRQLNLAGGSVALSLDYPDGWTTSTTTSSE